jgi:hypothetical protein
MIGFLWRLIRTRKASLFSRQCLGQDRESIVMRPFCIIIIIIIIIIIKGKR